MSMREWVMLPTAWIREEDLRKFRHTGSGAANRIAALMALIAIAQHANEETGQSRLTYDALTAITSLSRAKLAAGLDLLEQADLVQREPCGQSTFQFVGYDRTAGWGKLPAKKLYSGGVIAAFKDFHLRKRTELDALQLYLLIVAFRDNGSNLTRISYDSIEKYCGISRRYITAAKSLLTTHDLIYVEGEASSVSEFGVSHSYRLRHIDSYNHSGTRGRANIEAG